MVDNDMPGAWPVGTVGSIYKGETYTLVHTNMKGLGHMVSENKIFCFLP